MVYSQSIRYKFKEKKAQYMQFMTKKHFFGWNTYWLQHVYFKHFEHKISWISYHKIPILEGSHYSATPKLHKAFILILTNLMH